MWPPFPVRRGLTVWTSSCGPLPDAQGPHGCNGNSGTSVGSPTHRPFYLTNPAGGGGHTRCSYIDNGRGHTQEPRTALSIVRIIQFSIAARNTPSSFASKDSAPRAPHFHPFGHAMTSSRYCEIMYGLLWVRRAACSLLGGPPTTSQPTRRLPRCPLKVGMGPLPLSRGQPA